MSNLGKSAMAIASCSAPRKVFSDPMVGPLRQVARRQWVVLASVGMLRTCIAISALVLAAALILGRLDNVWIPARVAVAMLVWLGAGLTAWRLLRPAISRWNLIRAARLIERQKPEFQERLSSAVELALEKDPRFGGSPVLVEHLIRQAEADVAAVKPERLVRTNRIAHWALGFAPVVLAWLLVLVLPATSRPVRVGLYRLLKPWKQTLPEVLAQVIVEPGDVTLAEGDPLDITAHVSMDPAGETDIPHVLRQLEAGQRVVEQLEQIGPRDYRRHYDELRQGFKYQVASGTGDSPWFTVTIHPRPRITGIDVHYAPPAYTGLPPRTESVGDGAVESLVGTRVTLTIHTAQPVITETSTVVFDDQTPEQFSLPLKPARSGSKDYSVRFILNHSGQYKIRLANEFDLANRGEPPRSIVAVPDEPPTIAIQSPQSQVAVRPDDTVPVKYLATDDFGISKIEAVVQIDEHPPETVPVKFDAIDKRNVTSPIFLLSVPDALNAAKASEADHITYYLRAIDNRDPDPQSGVSARQVLKIDKNEWQSYQSKVEQKIADDLTDAMRKTIEDLDRNQPRVERVRDRGPKESIEEWNRNELHQAASELPRTANALQQAADRAADTVFEDVARKLRAIVDQPLRAAADNATQAELNLDNGPERMAAAGESVKQIVKARDALKKLLDTEQVRRDQQASEAARDLAEASRHQNAAARLMKPQDLARRDPQARKLQDQAMQLQNAATQRLQRAISNSQALQDLKAQETAGKLQELIRSVEDLEKQQTAQLEQSRQPSDESARQERQLAEQTQGVEHKARELQNQARSARNPSLANRTRRAQAALAQAERHETAAAHAQEKAAQAEHRGDESADADRTQADPRKSDQARQQAADEQRQAEEALARAESALRDLPRELADAEDSPRNGKDAGAKEQPRDQTQGGSQTAAEAAQEAAQAQQEAAQENPQAAQEAARALSRAASAMSDAVSKLMRPGEANGQDNGGEQAADEGQAGQERSTLAGHASDPKSGISVKAADAGTLPAAVRDVGITPDQWAKLPPMARKELLNTAQQSGPPAYRQMIKDYYVKIAKMQDSSASQRR